MLGKTIQMQFMEVELHLTAQSAKGVSNCFMMGLFIGYPLSVAMEESSFCESKNIHGAGNKKMHTLYKNCVDKFI